MTVAFGAEVENVRTGTTDPHTFAWDPGVVARAIILAAVHGVSLTDHIVTVTFGAVSLVEIIRRTDTLTEPGAAELWFVGRDIPTGSQTFSIDLASATTDDIQFVAWALTATGDCEVIDSDGIAENAADPTVTLQKNGREGWCGCAMYGGAAAPGGTLAAGNTLGPTEDLTAFYAQTCRETDVDAADHTIGWSTLGSDDLAFVALCVAEIIPRYPAHNHQNPALV